MMTRVQLNYVTGEVTTEHYATRVLLQNGFKARNIAGGMLSRSHLA